MAREMLANLLCVAQDIQSLPMESTGADFRFAAMTLPPGVYRVSILFDATAFDWARLWFPMHRFGNRGQQTGPWDFDFDHIEPIVPAWWVRINDQRIGLAAVRRPGPSDVLNRRMYLNFCFEVRETTQVHIELMLSTAPRCDRFRFALNRSMKNGPGR